MARKGPKTLGGWVVVNHGVRAAWRVQRLMMAWGLCRETLGRVPRVDEVMEFAKGTWAPATLYRDLELFREIFGEGTTPANLYEAMRSASPDVELAEQFYSVPASVRAAV